MKVMRDGGGTGVSDSCSSGKSHTRSLHGFRNETEGPDSINNFGSQLSRTYVDERKSNTSANDRDRLEGVGGHNELPALDMFAFSGPSLSILFLATNDSAFKSLKCPFHLFLNTCMMRYQISNQILFSHCPE